jgi:hypothetical protein
MEVDTQRIDKDDPETKKDIFGHEIRYFVRINPLILIGLSDGMYGLIGK